MTPARIVLGSLVTALALAGAFWLHSGSTKLSAEHHQALPPCTPSGFCLGRTLNGPRNVHGIPAYTSQRRANWQDPLAIFVAIAGLGLGRAIMASRPKAARGSNASTTKLASS